MQTSAGRMAIATSHLNLGGGDSPTPPPTPSILPDGAVEVEYIEFTDTKQNFFYNLGALPEIGITFNIPQNNSWTVFFCRGLGNSACFYIYGDESMILGASNIVSYTPRTDILFRSIAEPGSTLGNASFRGFVGDIDLGVSTNISSYVHYIEIVHSLSGYEALIGLRIKRGYAIVSDTQYDIIPCRIGSDAYIYDTLNKNFWTTSNPNNIPFILGPDV